MVIADTAEAGEKESHFKWRATMGGRERDITEGGDEGESWKEQR